MGYDLKDRKLSINEVEAKGVRHIYRRYLALGCVADLKAELDTLGIVSKVRLSRTGKTSGGLPYSRGALYELLQNRLYIGQTNHKKQAYPGEHDAVVAEELWKSVQAKLRSNVQGHRSGNRANRPSLLVGRVFTEEGERLIPSHTVKGGRRYRYYVAGPGAAKKVRVPASDLEQLVVHRVRAFLTSPGAVIDELGASSDAQAQHALVTAAARLVEPDDWSNSTRHTMDLVAGITRIVVGAKHVVVECPRSKLRSGLIGAAAPERGEDVSVRFIVPASFQRCGLQVSLVLPGHAGSNLDAGKPNASLVKAAARGRYWYEQLIAGAEASLTDLAAKSAVNDRYASRILRCAFLAPDIVERLLEGQIATDQTLRDLLGGPAKLGPAKTDARLRVIDLAPMA